MKAVLAFLICALALGEILEFNDKAVQKIMRQRNTALFLFISDLTSPENVHAHSAFKQYDKTQPDIVLCLSRNDDGHGLFQRLAQYLGVDVSATPVFLLFTSDEKKFKFDADSTNAGSLADFVRRAVSGAILPYFKSAPIPPPSDEPVKVIVGKSWNDVVLESEKEVLVKFYAPWCGHCKHLAPHFEEAARKLQGNPNVLIAKVDSTENQVPGLDVQSYPTVKFWRRDKSQQPIDFNGERTADGIVQWIKEHTEYDWIPPAEAEDAGRNQEL